MLMTRGGPLRVADEVVHLVSVERLLLCLLASHQVPPNGVNV